VSKQDPPHRIHHVCGAKPAIATFPRQGRGETMPSSSVPQSWASTAASTAALFHRAGQKTM
jgi:hypothetical protein